jgi:hypothetical protein
MPFSHSSILPVDGEGHRHGHGHRTQNTGTYHGRHHFLEFGLLLKLISSGKLANCLSTATHTADSMLFKISSGSRLNAKIINYKF